jgi:hypothetical protein
MAIVQRVLRSLLTGPNPGQELGVTPATVASEDPERSLPLAHRRGIALSDQTGDRESRCASGRLSRQGHLRLVGLVPK